MQGKSTTIMEGETRQKDSRFLDVEFDFNSNEKIDFVLPAYENRNFLYNLIIAENGQFYGFSVENKSLQKVNIGFYI